MGLDMYLKVCERQGSQPKEREGLYWRKSNQIHYWFVKNVQGGTDDCGEYPVSREQLRQLLEIVDKVLKQPDLGPTLLPVLKGFYFGKESYEDWFFQDLKDTKEGLELLFKLDRPEVEYYYRASW